MNDPDSILTFIGIFLGVFSSTSYIVFTIISKNGFFKVNSQLDFLKLNSDISSNKKILKFLEPYEAITRALRINSSAGNLQLLLQNESDLAIFIKRIIVKLSVQKNFVFNQYNIECKTFKDKIIINRWIHPKKSLCVDLMPTGCIPLAKVNCIVLYQESQRKWTFRYRDKLKYNINNVH